MPSTMTSRIDGLTTSVAVKAPIKIMATAPITLYGEQVINSVYPDGSTVSETILDGMRVGVNGQADQKQNGIYVARTTSWVRARDFDGSLDAVYGTLVTDSVPVIWRLTTPIPVLFGTSNIQFETEDGFNQGNLNDIQNSTDPAKGAALVGYKGRTVYRRLSDRTSIDDYSAIHNGIADDLNAVNSSIANAASGNVMTAPATYFVGSQPTNDYGVEYDGSGAICVSAYGGLRQINTYADKHKYAIGLEYLYKPYQRLKIDGQVSAFLFGDSTVAGGNGETAPYATDTIIRSIMSDKGMSNVNLINLGVGGTKFSDLNAIPSLSATSDLFIIKYGINDGGTGSPTRLADFKNSVRSKLAAIRAATNGAWQQTAILLVGPNATNDVPNGRDDKWYEQLRGIYVKAARDFNCAYFDAYAYLKDSWGTAGYSMDDPFADGRGIHPMDTMQAMLWGGVLDFAFPFGATRIFAKNNFVNSPAAAGAPVAATPATSYVFGESYFRATIAGGFPYEGACKTSRHADGVTSQSLASFATGVTRVITRTWDISGGSWNRWTGVPEAISLSNSWVAFDATNATLTPKATLSIDGMVTLEGSIKDGTITAGTVLGVLPVGMRPVGVCLFPIFMSGGTIGFIRINALGEVKTEAAANATITSLDGITFRAA
ncbi:SGNH/GDSL hydrolase family protein [Pseudomonas chlororaphis]|uniref:SGNH/GDSL hydrolase family protein n=1 Tax=Pseudomonas chlororaphis TaxID=587753 RepID=UPI00406BF083